MLDSGLLFFFFIFNFLVLVRIMVVYLREKKQRKNHYLKKKIFLFFNGRFMREEENISHFYLFDRCVWLCIYFIFVFKFIFSPVEPMVPPYHHPMGPMYSRERYSDTKSFLCCFSATFFIILLVHAIIFHQIGTPKWCIGIFY